MIAPSGRQFNLAFGDQQVVVVEVGGGLRTYTISGRDILDGYPVEEMASGGRGQLLAPWPNRIQDGHYTFDGREQQLPLAEASHGNAIHGLVRWVAWKVAEQEPHRVTLEHLLHPQPGYPFTVHLWVDYSLSADGLVVTTTATNVGPLACPYGSGAHPYLTLGTDLVNGLLLRSPAREVMTSDDRGIPESRQLVDGTPYDFRVARPIGDLVLDHAFVGLEHGSDGHAAVEVTDPTDGHGVEIWMDESHDHLMVFTGDTLPADRRRRGLAIEPMTCPPNAFRTGEDVIRLEPGASVTSTWGIRPLRPREHR